MTAILKVDEIQDTSGNLIIKEDSNTITVGKPDGGEVQAI